MQVGMHTIYILTTNYNARRASSRLTFSCDVDDAEQNLDLILIIHNNNTNTTTTTTTTNNNNSNNNFHFWISMDYQCYQCVTVTSFVYPTSVLLS